MRCIYCAAHSRLRERRDGRCPRCDHPFAFEPAKDRFLVTDVQFKAAVARVSGDGTVRFTARNLWYEFNRRWTTPRLWRGGKALAVPLMVLSASPGLILAQFIASTAMYAVAGVGALASLGVSAASSYREKRRLPPPPPMPFDLFLRDYLARWIEVHGPVSGLLPPRQQALAAMPKQVPADVAAFSFDRAVVTDRWETAQMLVANRFHFEHNCAVLSRDGYPDGIADTVREMLRRNPRLTVFALHDASPDGCHLPLVLREPEWFPDRAVRIVDLGLRPETVRRLRVSALKGPPVPPPPRLAGMLPQEDLAWLAHGHVGELAALRPAQVLRAAYQGIVAAGPNDGSGSDGSGGGTPSGGAAFYGGGVIWIGDLGGGADTAAVDGFG